jgi:hypothetical protein
MATPSFEIPPFSKHTIQHLTGPLFSPANKTAQQDTRLSPKYLFLFRIQSWGFADGREIESPFVPIVRYLPGKFILFQGLDQT